MNYAINTVNAEVSNPPPEQTNEPITQARGPGEPGSVVAQGTDQLTRVLRAKYERMVALGSWNTEMVEASARETVGRLTATLPKASDDEKMKFATLATQFNQAFWAGVSAERQRMEAYLYDLENQQRLAQAQAPVAAATIAAWGGKELAGTPFKK